MTVATIDESIRNDDHEAVDRWLDEGYSPDARVGSERLSVLAIACASGAERVKALLIEHGASATPDMLQKLATFPEATGLEAMLTMREHFEQPELQEAFAAAAQHRRASCGEVLAGHIDNWRFAIDPTLPLIPALAIRGWWFALERIDGVEEALAKPMDSGLVERLRQSNLRLPDEATAVDLATAKKRSLARFLTREQKNGGYVDERDRQQLATLETCLEWMKDRVPQAMAANTNAPRGVGDCDKGDRVEVVMGKQRAVGARGVIFWKGPSKHGPGIRVGVRTDDGRKIFAGLEEVELLED